jgi:transcriptional repressor NrdR
MHCPFCRHPDSRVVDSRESDAGAAIRRRRACPSCNRRFTTVETASLTVAKRSGATEPFSRAKVIAGVRKACSGRPVDEDALARLAQQVEETVRASGCAEIAAHDVGLAILAPLRDLDEVAYMRFASVYRGFEHLGDFEAEIAELRAHQALFGPVSETASSEIPASATAAIPRYGGAHDPAPPPVHATSAR